MVLSWMRFICLVVFSDRKNHHVGQESPPLSSVQHVTCREEGGGQWYLGWSQMNTTPAPPSPHHQRPFHVQWVQTFIWNNSPWAMQIHRLFKMYDSHMNETFTKLLCFFLHFISSNLHLLSPSLPKYRILNKPIRSLNEQNQFSSLLNV